MDAAVIARLKQWWFRWRGVDPQAVVVTFASGPAELVSAMEDEVRRLLPDRRHFTARADESMAELRARLRGHRIGMAPVLINASGNPAWRTLRWRAFLIAPRRLLAYNPRLERHHLKLSDPVSSLLFLRGVPLDRIRLRPWFWPWRPQDRTVAPGNVRVIEGRRASPLRAKAAVVTPFVPWPLSHGGAVRMHALLREAAVEFDIHLFAFLENETAFDELARWCERITLVPKPRYREPQWSTLAPPQVCEYRSAAMRRALGESAAAVTQVEYTQLGEYRGDILVEHDITADLFAQIHRRERSVGSWWNWWRWRRFEQAALSRARAAVVMSEKDAALSGHRRAVVIGNGVDLARFTPVPEPEGGAARLLFVGSFRHFPNITAFRFFVDEVWPRLLRRFPALELTVVAGPDPLLYWQSHTGERDLPQPERVRLLGFVADVKPLYEQANVVIVPTLVSAGTNLKVLEAMAMERAVVSTGNGCAGLGLVHGESVWIADGAEAFADGVARLIDDGALRGRMARAGRAHAVSHFSWRRLGLLQRALWREFAPSPLLIRPAVAADGAAVEEIQRASPEAAHWPVADYFAHAFAVAELAGGGGAGELVGFAVWRQTAPDEFELLNFAVAPGWRGHGAGRRLLEHVLEACPGDVFLEVRESNGPARKLYESAGFAVTATRPGYYQEPSESGIVMRFRKC